MSPFAVLGVPHDVDDAALKKAYFKKLREHPPETDPAEFQKVQEAFEQLRDPHRRRAAAEPQLPERLRELLERAQRSADASQALKLLEQATREFPDSAPAHVMHVSCLSGLKPDEGLAAARGLAGRFATDLEVRLLLAALEKGEPRRAALAKAQELAPSDRRAWYLQGAELTRLQRYDEALAALDAAQRSSDHRFISDAQLEGARLRLRIERNERLNLDHATPELASTLVSLAAAMLETKRTRTAAALLDKVQSLQPARPPIPIGPSRHLPLAQLPAATRAAVERNATEPSRNTVHVRTPQRTKGWVAKPVWWVELRPLHLIVRRANGVQICPILSLELQQREADVPLMLCDGADAGLGGMPELAWLFQVAIEQRGRLLDLMSRDLIETMQVREPLQWTLSSNA